MVFPVLKSIRLTFNLLLLSIVSCLALTSLCVTSAFNVLPLKDKPVPALIVPEVAFNVFPSNERFVPAVIVFCFPATVVWSEEMLLVLVAISLVLVAISLVLVVMLPVLVAMLLVFVAMLPVFVAISLVLVAILAVLFVTEV